MVNMNKVMVLGAGRGQIPIMNLCHKYGWYVVAISPEGNYPGLEIADKVYSINVSDKESVLSVAKEEGIQAILTDQLDAGVLTSAYVAEHMDLRGITSEVALKFTDKFVMRQEAEKCGIHVPLSFAASNMEDVRLLLAGTSGYGFPLVMKPVDSSASRGVYKVNSLAEIEEQFELSKRWSKTGQVIIEQYIEGKEYVVEAFTRDHEVMNLAVGHRDYFQIPNTFIPNATVFLDAESADSNLEMRLKEINKRLIEGYGLNFGITHGEYLYNEKEDKIYLVEIAARGGGVFISSDLIPGASGVDANDLLVREALGIADNAPIKIRKGAAAYFCYLTPPGTVSVLDGLEAARQIDGVIKAYFDNIEIGMVSQFITDKSSRKGPVLVKGTSKSDCYDVIEQVKKVLNIKIKNGNEVFDVIWHDKV